MVIFVAFHLWNRLRPLEDLDFNSFKLGECISTYMI